MSEESNIQDLLDFSDNANNVNVNVDNQEENNLIGDILDQIAPSAPPAPASSDDFIVVNGDKGSSSNSSDTQEETNKMLLDLANSIQDSLKADKIIAAADSPSSSSSASVVAEPPKSEPAPAPKAKTPTAEPSKAGSPAKEQGSCIICPYYALGCDYVKKIQVPAYVSDLLLWKNPKLSGIVFGTELVLLISLASFSLLTVIGSLMLLALSAVGAYRFYLALMFRIKGTPDQTFEKLSKYDVSLPKEKIKQLTSLLEEDVNKVIRKTKSIILWDNITSSSLAFIGFYFVYCIGSIFNTLTLLILGLVTAFTLPKVYQIYKEPIDSVIEKTTAYIHLGVKQVLKKLPFLSKKKVQ